MPVMCRPIADPLPAMTDKLTDLRRTINQLDDQILDLIDRRMTLAGDIIAAKRGRAAFRPGREAQVMERLAAAAPNLPRQLVTNVWRQLMTASTVLQDDHIQIAVHHDAMAVAGWHFGGLADTLHCADIGEVKAGLGAGATLALVPESLEHELAAWLLQDDAYFIVARTPYHPSPALPPVLLIGREPSDEVADEVTLVARQTGGGVVLDRLPGRKEGPVEGVADRHRVIGVIAVPKEQVNR